MTAGATTWPGRHEASNRAWPGGATHQGAELEQEINQNGWLHCTADSELIFGQDTDGKYAKAMKKIGIDLGMLSSEAGHA